MQPATTTTTTTTPTTIDLHGYRKSEAIAALTSFLERNQGQGWVTVITGSGAHSHNGPILRTAVQSLLEKRQMEFTLNRGKGSFLVNADSGFVLYDPEAPTDTKVVLQKASSANNKDYSSFTPMSKLVARAPPVSHMIPLPSEVATINDTNPKAMEKEIKKETNNDWEKDMNPLPSEVAANDANQKAMEKEIKKETKEIEQALSLSMKDHLTPKEDELRKAQKEVDEKDLQREVYDNLQWAATTTTTTARTNHRHPQDARTGRYSQPDHRFWKSKPDAASIDDDSNNCATALKSPDWSISTRWRPTMTSRFHHCLRNKKRTDRNLAFNILLAVATPELKLLASHQPVVDNNGNHPRWQRSRMKQHDVLEIIWVAKEYQWDGGRVEDKHYVGQVEAHFAGSRDECLQFVQKFLLVPKSSRNPTKDMSAIIPSNDGATTHTTQIDYAWLVDNDLQGAVLDDVMEDLPEGLFVLDPDQERIVTLKPPLLIESRSGTGKTNVLFKHAVSYFGSTLEEISRPVCFVTVSPRLCEELQRRYQTIEQINHVSLPPVQFFCLKSLLDKLLRMAQLDNIMEMSFVCTFWHYLHARKTYKKLSEEPSLVENEIGKCEYVGGGSFFFFFFLAGGSLTLLVYLSTTRRCNHRFPGSGDSKRTPVFAAVP